MSLAHQHYGEAHPRIERLAADVEFARQVLAERETQLRQDHPGRALSRRLRKDFAVGQEIAVYNGPARV